MKVKLSLLITLFCVIFSACTPDWQIDITTRGQPSGSIQPDMIAFYINELGYEKQTVHLAQVLWHQGFTLIDQISLYNGDVLVASYDWERIAEQATIDKSGQIEIEEVVVHASTIDVNPSPLASEINLSIIDLAPSMAKALGLPPLPESQGFPYTDITVEHGVMILVDGLQYQKLHSMIAQGSLPFFQSIPIIHQGITVFPSVTTSSTAALLTGALPQVNGVFGYGYRSTDMKTLFDHAVDHGLSVTAVEGHSLPFNLRNAEVILSGDRDGDGFTDDNVLANSLQVIAKEMPDLLYIHFHDVDDMGHQFGPDSSEYQTAIMRVDGYLLTLFNALPADTFVAIFADHGMQNDTTGTGGNHGQLTESSMVIPIIFLEK